MAGFRLSGSGHLKIRLRQGASVRPDIRHMAFIATEIFKTLVGLYLAARRVGLEPSAAIPAFQLHIVVNHPHKPCSVVR